MKDLKAKLIDSTYLNASDPNSMRDLGMTRNAEYTFAIGELQNKLNSTEYSKYMVPKGKPTNNTFYSFGGRSSIL
jgi:HKD family nuclease